MTMATLTLFSLISTFLAIILVAAFFRLLYILPATNPTRPNPRSRKDPTHIYIMLGSGGHTAEMLYMLSSINPHDIDYRTYVLGSGDDFSTSKAEEFERNLSNHSPSPRRRLEKTSSSSSGTGADLNISWEEIENPTKTEEEEADTITDSQLDADSPLPIPLPQLTPHPPPHVPKPYSIHPLPRARKIHQPLLTTPLTAFRTLTASIHLLQTHPQGYPDLIITNGPATGVILILAVTIIRYFSFLPSPPWRRRCQRQPQQYQQHQQEQGEDKAAEQRKDGAMRIIYAESWARVRTPSLSCRVLVYGGLANRVLVQWRELEERGWESMLGGFLVSSG